MERLMSGGILCDFFASKTSFWEFFFYYCNQRIKDSKPELVARSTISEEK
jgi:hypothetical protein